MLIYPAIDLRGGKVVRLREGDPNQQTVFSDDPVATAKQWIEAGAEWIHVVNLDGAFAEANNNRDILAQIAQLDVKVQFGGGLRTMADIGSVIEQGASRVVLGTIALKAPEIVEEAVQKFGAERVCVALDAKDGKVTTHGWTTASELTPEELGNLMVERGVQHALFTDVSRDGQLTGSNVEATIALAKATNLQVIASGGVSGLEELQTLKDSGVVAGAVIGMALYTGQMQLADALAVVGEE